ncbi:hypothetical protein ILUMI_07885 [Ignelater luminosus]|uniref:Uncharacterized protein n=1 Tax=Ignelater luminosus TaxID=2038154 RepID=A0A8K0GGF6_IGNLU|nr:hypothetical protein ILUMI_07885 [Ignelater luminosus]
MEELPKQENTERLRNILNKKKIKNLVKGREHKAWIDSDKVSTLRNMGEQRGRSYGKALNKEAGCFQYLEEKFSDAKLKEGIFIGPDIKKLMKHDIFETKLEEDEKEAWSDFKEVVNKLLENQKDPKFKNIVENMLTRFQDMEEKILTKDDNIIGRLKEYLEELLGTDIRTKDDKGEEGEGEITMKKLNNAMRKIKIGKVAGVDEISPEQLKYIGVQAANHI